jgi:hypothetical protein
MSFDGTEFGREVVAAVRGHLERSVGTMLERLEALERRVAEAAPGPLPPDVLRPMVAEEVGKAVAALPAPAVPPALVGSLIDREGVLVLTLSDGEVRHVGPVVGRDADPAALLAAVREEVARLPVPENGKDGRDGFGFDDLAVEHDGDRRGDAALCPGRRDARRSPSSCPWCWTVACGGRARATPRATP